MERKEYTYKSCPDGTKIPLDVYYLTATTADRSPKPVAIYIHGGGWTIGSKSEVPPYLIDKLLENGFVVVSIDHRLCPTISAWDGAYADSKDAYEWCRNELGKTLGHETEGKVVVDGDRIVSIGASAGGILSALVDQLSIPPKAILDLYTLKYLNDPSFHSTSGGPPPSLAALNPPATFDKDLLAQVHKQIPPPTSFTLIDPSTFKPDFTNPRTAYLFDCASKADLFNAALGPSPSSSTSKEDVLALLDPMTFISSSRGHTFPPTIILHGTADDAVPLSLSKDMAQELKSKGVEVELIELEGMPHGFDAMMDYLPGEGKRLATNALDHAVEFLKRHV